MELPMSTVVQVPVQLVTSVTYWLGFTVICTLGWPSQAALTVLETDPPLKAVSRTNRLGVTKVIESLVRPGPLNLTLLVVLAPRGAERYQRLIPQSIMPVGYSPLSARLGWLRSSNVTVNCAGGGVAVTDNVGMAVGEAVGVDVGLGVAVGVCVGVDVAVGLAVGVGEGDRVGDGDSVDDGEGVDVGLSVGEGDGVAVDMAALSFATNASEPPPSAGWLALSVGKFVLPVTPVT